MAECLEKVRSQCLSWLTRQSETHSALSLLTLVCKRTTVTDITQANTHFAVLKVKPIPGYIRDVDSKKGISFALSCLNSDIWHRLISEGALQIYFKKNPTLNFWGKMFFSLFSVLKSFSYFIRLRYQGKLFLSKMGTLKMNSKGRQDLMVLQLTISLQSKQNHC